MSSKFLHDDDGCNQYKRLGSFEAIALIRRRPDNKMVWRWRNDGHTLDYEPEQFSSLATFEIYIKNLKYLHGVTDSAEE